MVGSLKYPEKNKKTKLSSNIKFLVTEHSGLLEFLLSNLKKQSRNNVKSLLSHRQVLVDGKIITQYDYPLKNGQTIQILPSINRQAKQHDELKILYEDPDLIVINKPAGLLSIASDREKERTAYHFATNYVRRSQPTNRIFIVHRLDRDTSGVLMFAKNQTMKQALQDQWDSLVSRRGYVAIVEGKLSKKSGRVQSWLKETKTMLMYSSNKPGDGLKAITNYEVIKENKDVSLVKIHLETGRKNQIRVHMKDLGHPVVGDKKYGAKTNPLKRLGLHAYKLELTHPFSNQLLCFETAIPKSFTALF